MVMAYILFVNGSIIAKPLGLDASAVAAGTALVAGIMTIAMGVIGKYPFALAAGLGINAIVAFTLTAKGLDAKGAMGVIVLEGIAITILVAVGLREAIMEAVPLALKRSIGVGIGLFILFIGFSNGGLIGSNPTGKGTPVFLAFPTTPAQGVFLLGLAITFVLYARRIRAALIISIIVTTIIAILAGVTSVPAADKLIVGPNFSTIGLGLQDPFQAFAKLGAITAVLTIFAIMLSDFFDTMGTVTGIAAEAGLARPDGTVPGIGRVLMVDSVAAIAGGVGGVSSNTTYIESAAGVAEGGRTGFASVVTGVLFLLAMFFSPLASVIPAQATAPALIVVGFFMMTIARDIPWEDYEEAIPAFVTMLTMPFTWSITNGIGAGFVTYVAIKVLNGKGRRVHWMVYLVAAAFVVYFALPLIEKAMT